MNTALMAGFAVLSLAGFSSSSLGCAAPLPDQQNEPLRGTRSAILDSEQDGPANAFPEAVQVLHDNGVDYCTGVLVHPRVVLTAAHCIVGETFTIMAPFATGAPRRIARLGEVMSDDFDSDPAAHDVAVLRLDAPIKLSAYAIMTDIGARADDGTSFEAIAVGRSREERTAGLVRSKVMTLTSAANDGYTSGLRSTYYSGGGDSGGPVFLVEESRTRDGSLRITHQLVGLERQPEPSRNIDYFTRIDDAVKAASGRWE